jgi:hypothetical protein
MLYAWVGIGLGALCFVCVLIAVVVFVRRRKKVGSDAATDGIYSTTAASDVQSARTQIYGSAPISTAEYGGVSMTAYSGMPETSEILYASANVSKREIVYDSTLPNTVDT